MHQQDVQTQVILFSNNLIQQGNVAFTSSSPDDTVLELSKSFHGSMCRGEETFLKR